MKGQIIKGERKNMQITTQNIAKEIFICNYFQKLRDEEKKQILVFSMMHKYWVKMTNHEQQWILFLELCYANIMCVVNYNNRI